MEKEKINRERFFLCLFSCIVCNFEYRRKDGVSLSAKIRLNISRTCYSTTTIISSEEILYKPTANFMNNMYVLTSDQLKKK